MKVPSFARLNVRCCREDTPDELAQRIHVLEYDTYPKVIEKLLESEV